MNTFVILMSALLLFFGFIRNTVTLINSHKAVDAIRDYLYHLVDINQYDRSANYFDVMPEKYFTYMFSFWKWTKYSVIKKEYRELIRPYFN